MKPFSIALLFVSASFAQDIQPTEPITNAARLNWAVKSTVGAPSLLGGAISAGFGTWVNAPHEYRPHWNGFVSRYGMRMTGVATSNAMEAGLGAFWGEDPRYLRAQRGVSFGGRVGHVAKLTFLAPNRDGDLHPAYARYVAITGSNALSNTWRADSEADTNHFLERTALGFLGRMAGNAFEEFWPDAKRKLFHRNP